MLTFEGCPSLPPKLPPVSASAHGLHWRSQSPALASTAPKPVKASCAAQAVQWGVSGKVKPAGVANEYRVAVQGVPDYKECSELFFRDFEPLKSIYNEFDTCSFCKITVYTYDF